MSFCKKDVEALNYISADRNDFYVCVDGSVYGIDMTTRQTELLVSGLKEDCYGSSGSGRYFAWTEGEDAYHASVLTILDLDTRQKQTISCGDSERLRFLGFLDEAAVYGIADASDIHTEHKGREFFPDEGTETGQRKRRSGKRIYCRKQLCDRCGHRRKNDDDDQSGETGGRKLCGCGRGSYCQQQCQ
mgnify:CR=1 FL=1